MSVEDKLGCEGKVTLDECKSALDRMQKGKSPGCDGLTVNFYKALWPVVGPTLIEA